MKKLSLLCCALLCLGAAKAQTASVSPNVIAAERFDGRQQNFLYTSADGLQYNVNSVLEPRTPSDEARLTMETYGDILVQARVVNAEGKQVLAWSPEQASRRFFVRWNLKKLPAGKYTIEILSKGVEKPLQEIAFSKS